MAGMLNDDAIPASNHVFKWKIKHPPGKDTEHLSSYCTRVGWGFDIISCFLGGWKNDTVWEE